MTKEVQVLRTLRRALSLIISLVAAVLLLLVFGLGVILGQPQRMEPFLPCTINPC